MSFQRYIDFIETWKTHPPDVKSYWHPGYQAHHPIPRAFKKIKDEHKHELTRQLEALYDVDETVLVPDRVHFEVHMLLVEMYPERSQEWFKMSFALGWFLGKRQARFDITPVEYEHLRVLNCEAKREAKVSDETRKKLSKAAKGRKPSKKPRPWSNEARKRASERNLVVQNRPEVKQHQREIQSGKTRSLETRKRMSDAQHINQNRPEVKAKKSGANHTSSRAVEQYTREGVFIARYEALVDTRDATGVRLSGIYACCNGRYTHSAGFVWKYVDKLKKGE